MALKQRKSKSKSKGGEKQKQKQKQQDLLSETAAAQTEVNDGKYGWNALIVIGLLLIFVGTLSQTGIWKLITIGDERSLMDTQTATWDGRHRVAAYAPDYR